MSVSESISSLEINELYAVLCGVSLSITALFLSEMFSLPGPLALLLFWIVGCTSGSETEPSSVLSNQDTIMSLKQKVLELEDKMSLMEDSVPLTIQETIEDLLLTILDKMAENSKNYARTNKEMDQKFQALLSRYSLRMEQLEKKVALRDDDAQISQKLIKQGSLISKLSSQLEDVQTLTASFDTTFILLAHYKRNEPHFVFNVTCYSERNPQMMKFSRLMDSGTDLPKGAKTYSRGKAAVLDLTGVEDLDRPGVYECGYEKDGKHTAISFLLQRGGYFGRPLVASVGDSVVLESYLSEDPTLRWLHDGQRVPTGDGHANLLFARLTADDAGIYEAYYEGNRQGSKWFKKLIVRGCRAGFFGERCDHECRCYNGGICHDKLGFCICPSGFEGRRCEVACGENLIGPHCNQSCDGGDCSWHVFCRPDPRGCTCAPGYWNLRCESKDCTGYHFGADCHQHCHCNNGKCNMYTGACPGDCSRGWTGQSCQIPAGE